MIPTISTSDQRFLSSMNQIDNLMTQAETQVTSGRRINVASDHPDQVSDELAARANLEQTLQIETNLGNASTEASTADQALSGAVSLFDQLTTIGAQGATGTQDPAQRQTLAVQAGSILDQLVSTAATQINGRYIFSGDSDQVEPYTLVQPPSNPDGSVPPLAVSGYCGSAATRQIMHPNGSLFSVSQTAQQIFDAPNASAFQAVTDLRDALNNIPTVPAGDPNYNAQYDAQTAQINTALNEVKNAQDHISQSLAFYGVVENRISAATTFAGNQELQQREQLSTLQDADPTTAIMDLTQAITQRETALEARAKIPNKSLFDYLG